MKAFIVVALALSSWLQGQDCHYKFSGIVKDFHDGSPMERASVRVKKTNSYTVTSADGTFTLNGLCQARITLVITHIACETKTITVDVFADNGITILLEHHIESLQEVSISGNLDTERALLQKTNLSKSTIEAYSSKNLGDALKEISGVASLNTGNSIVKPMINGMHSSRVIIITDGVRLEDQEWGEDHAPNLDINAFEKIAVIKGSGALAYAGDAVGGVVVLGQAKPMLKDTLFGKTITSGQSNGLGGNISTMVSKTFKNGWFANFQGSYKRYGDFHSPTYSLTNTGLNSANFSTKFGYNRFEKGFNASYTFVSNEVGILKASHVGNVEDLLKSIDRRQPYVVDRFSYDINPPRQQVYQNTLKLQFYKRFSRLGKLDAQYDFQENHRYEYDVRIGKLKNTPAIDLTLKTHTFSTGFNLDYNKQIQQNVGIVFRFQNNFPDPATKVQRLIPDYDKYDFASFYTVDWLPSETLTLDAGVRYDYNVYNAKAFYHKTRWVERGYDKIYADLIKTDYGTQLLVTPNLQYHNISASLGLKKVFGHTNTVLANYALSSRTPNSSELFSNGLHHSAARIELGNIGMSREISNRFGATYRYASSSLFLETETFVNQVQGYIYAVPTSVEQSIRGAFPVWEYKQTNARLFGIDLTLTYNINQNWSFTNKSAYLQGDDLKDQKPIVNIPPFKTVNTLAYANKKWLNLKVDLKSEWVFMQNRYPNTNFEQYVISKDSTVLVDLSTPPAAYHLLHTGASIAVMKNHMNIGLIATNILDTPYRDYLDRLRYFVDQLGRNVMIQVIIKY